MRENQRLRHRPGLLVCKIARPNLQDQFAGNMLSMGSLCAAKTRSLYPQLPLLAKVLGDSTGRSPVF